MSDVNFVLRKLGISPKLKGFHYLSAAVRMILSDEDYLFRLSRNLYPKIAALYRTSLCCIDRNMRTAVQILWDRGNRAFLQEIAGYELLYKPTVREMLDILVVYCQSQQSARALQQGS